MTAKFTGISNGFKANLEYNIETTLINNIIYVKDKFSSSFRTYCSVEEFLKDWDVKVN